MYHRILLVGLIQLLCMSSFANCSDYPSKHEIASIFGGLGTQAGYLKFIATSVAADVKWTLMGTHQLAGTYNNRTIFVCDAVVRLADALDMSKPSSFTLVQPVIGGDDEPWSVQQLHGTGVFKNGMIYDNRFSWATKWNKNRQIIEVNAYFDSGMVAEAISSNESPVYNYTSVRNTIVTGPTILLPQDGLTAAYCRGNTQN